MSGHLYSEPEPIRKCPYCGTPCEADFVDVGVGMIQCGPYHCDLCLASEIGPYDKGRTLTEDEKRTGWYAPGAEPGSSANVIHGRVVSANVMKQTYDAEYTGNPNHAVPGHVDSWRQKLREAIPVPQSSTNERPVK